MKKEILIFAVIAAVSFTSCNNATPKMQEVKKEEQHDSAHKKASDSVGMKMGGNELDSKKK